MKRNFVHVNPPNNLLCTQHSLEVDLNAMSYVATKLHQCFFNQYYMKGHCLVLHYLIFSTVQTFVVVPRFGCFTPEKWTILLIGQERASDHRH